MPTVTHKTPVYHVGHLNELRDPPRYSYEGDGLSVSEHPDAWKRIARDVHGTTYELSNADAEFYTITPSELPLDKHVEWCVEHDYVTKTLGYRVTTGNGRYTSFYDPTKAEVEANAHGTVVEPTTVYALDTSGVQYWENGFSSSPETASPIGVEGLLPVWYAENALDVDGVWWEYEFAPHDYSAPTGVIFQPRLVNWTIKPVDEN